MTYTLKYRSHMGHEFESDLRTALISSEDVWRLAVSFALDEIRLHNELDDLASLEIR